MLVGPNASAAVGDISVVAGTGIDGHSGDGGPATAAQIGPAAIALDGANNIYMTNLASQTVRKVDAATGVISTIAGQPGISSPWGFTGGNGVPATQTTLLNPAGLAVDKYGDVYIGELQGARLRRVDRWTGIISTVAGTGAMGSPQEGAIANQTNLFYVPGVAIGSNGNLFITDIGRMGVWQVSAATRKINGVVLDPAVFWFPQEIETDSADNLYVASLKPARILRISSLGGAVETLATPGADVRGIALDGADNVFFTLANSGAVSRIDAMTRTITTVATIAGATGLGDIEIDADGNLFVAGSALIYRIEGLGVPAGGASCTP